MMVHDDGTLTLASVGEMEAATDRVAELSRRQFLKLSGGIGGGLMLGLVGDGNCVYPCPC